MTKARKIELVVYRILFVVLIIGGIGYTVFYHTVPNIDDSFTQTEVPEELIGKDFAWRYDIGWDFYVQIEEDGIHWEGLAGDFEGMSMTVDPRYTVLDDGIYFVTWNVQMANGYDSLIINMNTDEIYAHSKANAKSIAIEGEIYYNSLTGTGVSPK